MQGFDLAVGFLLFAGAFQAPQLFLGGDHVFLGSFGFQRFESFAEGFQIVA